MLGVRTPEEAAAAAERLGGRVLVARQVGPGPEAFVGLARDPDYGPILAVGPGGSSVERYGAGATALAPVDLETARVLVAEADVNPLVLSPDGAVAVDALVVYA